MKLYVRLELLQFCAVVLNFIFLALGLSLSGVGAWILLDETNLLHEVASEDLQLVAVGLLLIGALVVLVNFAGFLGATRQNRLLLLLYLGSIVILVLLQLFVTLLLLLSRDKIRRSLSETVDQIIVQYGNTSNDQLMDHLQHHGACCGVVGPADWLKNSYVQTRPEVLPCSCFRWHRRNQNSPWCSERPDVTEPPVGEGNGTLVEGCDQKLSDWLEDNALTIISMDISIVLVQVLQFTVIVYLYRAVSQKEALRSPGALADLRDGGHAPDNHLDYGEQNYAYTDPDGDHVDLDYHLHPPEDQNHYQDLRY